MSPSRPTHVRRHHSRAVGCLLCISIVTTAGVCPLTVAAGSATRPATTLFSPPDYPDVAHVVSGCHLSTLAYLTQFLADHPTEQGRPLVLAMRNADGQRRPHTVALLSWRGAWWCRDEFFGLVALDRAVSARPDFERLQTRALGVLENHFSAELQRRGGTHPLPPASTLGAMERLRAVTLATQILPLPTTVFLVRSRGTDIPLLFFRPSPRQIAVYDPLHGTSIAECASPDDAGIVAAVAQRLGYAVEDVQPARRALLSRDPVLAAAGAR